jgi:uncharacterized membrane protein YagU involved in acid resistance
MKQNGALAHGVARGAVAAMAMTGVRRITTGLGLVDQPPPERIAREGFPHLLALVSREHQDEAIELAHWTYGAVAGGVYSLLPETLRRRRWSGPAYGLAIWALFEAGVVPLVFRMHSARNRRLVERLSIAADHVLYGIVVGARPQEP